ncbi:MAG: 2Fe-2S iron-sulfur cluster-binding protein [Nitrospiria bacterium]
MEKKIPISINEKTIEVEEGISVLAASMQAGVKHMHLCGGRGLCSTCRVRVLEGEDQLSAMTNYERFSLRGHLSFAADVRLACQARVKGPVKIKTIFPTIGRLDFKDA